MMDIIRKLINKIFSKQDKAWEEFVDVCVETYLKEKMINTTDKDMLSAVRMLIIGKIRIQEQSNLITEITEINTELEETIMIMLTRSNIPENIREMARMKDLN